MMRTSSSACRCGAAILTLLPRAASAGDATNTEDENQYGRQGTLEVGGSFGVNWASNVLAIQATPTVGMFVRDRIELSSLLTLEYIRTTTLLGQRTSQRAGSLLFEPSYHLPVEDYLQVFGGLGIGAGYDGQHPDFDLIPRVGVNIKLGRGGVLSPAVSMPILIGKSHGENGNTGVDVGVNFAVGVATVL